MTIKELNDEIKVLMLEVKKHRCRKQTGNWCLDCEIKNARATGILFAIENLTKHNNDFKKVCPECGSPTLSRISENVIGCSNPKCTYIGKPIIKS